jgi:NAD(P)-dependent dehydrogenase (short-subunit alcohol dehydrogenase family)
VALVTGAAAGIVRACALALSEQRPTVAAVTGQVPSVSGGLMMAG